MKQRIRYEVTVASGINYILNPTSRPRTHLIDADSGIQAVTGLVRREYRKARAGQWKPAATNMEDRYENGRGICVEDKGPSDRPRTARRRPGPNYQLQALASRTGYENSINTSSEKELIDFIGEEYERLRKKPKREIFQLYLDRIEEPDKRYHAMRQENKILQPPKLSGRRKRLRPQDQKEQMKMAI